ncbi:hypothetical protein Kuja_1680 [Vibrio phage vB_VchM_Kuja]|uniref:Prohead core scaffold protein n=1 Tax=Vibrio phage vB_VchM_Kuja TaxID=2686437 RepID=A0A6B9J5C6_9CAUD|nr:hypothetical protein HWC83_gp067 [Vibrio phage vB_VchM_Kuja]QGZ16160.1 hypothetical protein Kuja_1680 [Vibrio phage vB_VchM_Kuja]
MSKNIKTILEGVEGLPAQMVESLTQTFEEAVNAKAEEIVESKIQEREAELVAENENVLTLEKENIKQEMVEAIDQFLDSIVGQIVSENAIAIDSLVKVQLAESLLTGLHGLLAEHDISNPDSKQVIENAEERVREERQRANKIAKEAIQLRAENVNLKRESVLNTVTAGLALTECERVKTLSEGIQFVDAETFTEALKPIVEEVKKASHDGGGEQEAADPEKDGKGDDEEKDDKKQKSEGLDPVLESDDEYRQHFLKGTFLS